MKFQLKTTVLLKIFQTLQKVNGEIENQFLEFQMSSNVSLLILAGGIGSRYQSSKQIDAVGPSGQFLLEYSIYDAIRAGFNKIVLVVN